MSKSQSVEPVQTGSPSFRFAVINTVDTLKRFPARGVYLFATRKEAVLWAADAIRRSNALVENYSGSPYALLLDFQDTLSPTEFFHVEKVRKP